MTEEGHYEPEDDIHTYFGLSYCSHLVLPRVLLQSMPEDWQEAFVELLREYNHATCEVDQPESYDVKAAVQKEAWELTVADLRRLGMYQDPGDDCFYDADGNCIDRCERVLVPVPDPLPPYNRGRTRIPLIECQP